MKKIFALLLVLAIMLSMAIPVFAAEEKVEITEPWVKYFSKEDIVTSTDGGATVYTFSGITAAYISAGVDILPALKTLIEGKDKITVNISVDAKLEYNAGFEGEDYTIAGLIRAVDVNEKIKDPEQFKSLYYSAKAGGFGDTGGGNYSIRFFEDGAIDDKWATLEGEATFTANDIKAGLWGKLNLCFDRMNGFEAAKSISVKNAKIELIDYEEGDGEITIDLESVGTTNTPTAPPTDDSSNATVDTSEIDLTANADAEDIEELPDGNALIEGTKWTKGMGSAVVTEGTFKEQAMYSMTGYNSAYSSAYLDLYPSLKQMIGDEDELQVYIVLDVRVLNYKGAEGDTHPFGVKIRPGGLTDLAKDEETFNGEYTGTTFKHNGTGGISVTLLGSGKKELTEDWQRLELTAYFTADDLNDAYWSQLNLCFDNMANFKSMGAVQIKNSAIFNADDYEPIGDGDDEGKTDGNTGDTTVKKPVSSTDPVVLHKPIGFNKYTVTFMDAIETEVEGGLVDNGANAGIGGGNSTLIIIIAAAAAVVVVGAVVVIVIVSKKKKNTVKEDKE